MGFGGLTPKKAPQDFLSETFREVSTHKAAWVHLVLVDGQSVSLQVELNAVPWVQGLASRVWV